MGKRKLKRIYSDNAAEIDHCAGRFGCVIDHSPADTPKANGVIERQNRVLEEAARALLIRAGLPPFYWNYAVRYAALMINLTTDKDLKKSPWQARHKGQFVGVLAPFGCEVACIAPDTGAHSRKKLKFFPKNRCIFWVMNFSLGVYLNSPT